MRKYFFRPFIADPACASSDPGHHVDVGRYFMAVAKSSVTVPVRAQVGDELIRLDWDGQSTELWNHRPDDVALRATQHQRCRRVGARMAGASGAESIARRRTHRVHARLSDERTECVTESFSPVGPRWIRRS